MQGLWLEDQHLSYREDVPKPQPPPGEAVIRVRLAGICATDLEMVRGYYPFTGVLGHEFVGEVVEAAGAKELLGQRVVGEINASCGKCVHCRSGRRTHCMQRTVLGIRERDGAFASFLTLPIENLHLVPPNVPDEMAVFTEPLAAALEILEQVQIRPGERVLVLGAGRLGQLVASVVALTGCDLAVAVRRENQRRLLEDQGISTLPVDEIPSGELDLVIDATGSPQGFQTARRAVRPRGTLVMKSTYAGNLDVNMSSIVVDEVRIIGSRCGPFPPALRLLASGKVDPRPLIEGRFPLRQGVDAFSKATQPGVLKVLLEPSR